MLEHDCDPWTGQFSSPKSQPSNLKGSFLFNPREMGNPPFLMGFV